MIASFTAGNVFIFAAKAFASSKLVAKPDTAKGDSFLDFSNSLIVETDSLFGSRKLMGFASKVKLVKTAHEPIANRMDTTRMCFE